MENEENSPDKSMENEEKSGETEEEIEETESEESDEETEEINKNAAFVSADVKQNIEKGIIEIIDNKFKINIKIKLESAISDKFPNRTKVIVTTEDGIDREMIANDIFSQKAQYRIVEAYKYDCKIASKRQFAKLLSPKLVEFAKAGFWTPKPSDTVMIKNTDIDDKEVEEFANNINKFAVISGLLNKLHVGDNKEKMAVFLSLITGKTQRPINFAVKGVRSAGKTNLINSCIRLMPTGWVLKCGSMSDKALYHLKDTNAATLYLQELVASGETTHTLKLSSSDDGGLEYWTVQKEKKTGEFVTVKKQLNARQFITTTTSPSIDDELQSRMIEFNLVNTINQINSILDFKADSYAFPYLNFDLNPTAQHQAKIIQNYLLTLPYKMPIIIPFSHYVASILPSNGSDCDERLKRDYDKITSLIKAVTLFDYKNRIVVYYDEKEQQLKVANENTPQEKKMLMASLYDIDHGWRLFEPIFQDIICGLDDVDRAIYTYAINSFDGTSNNINSDSKGSITVRADMLIGKNVTIDEGDGNYKDIRIPGLSIDKINERLEKMRQMGLFAVDAERDRPNNRVYTLNHNVKTLPAKFNIEKMLSRTVISKDGPLKLEGTQYGRVHDDAMMVIGNNKDVMLALFENYEKLVGQALFFGEDKSIEEILAQDEQLDFEQSENEEEDVAPKNYE